MTPTVAPDPTLFSPASIDQHIAYLAHAVVGHFSRTDRKHPGVTFDTRAITRLQDVATAWHGAENLSAAAFRSRFFDQTTGDDTVEGLRHALQQAANARNYDDLAGASKALAKAMASIGLDRWRGMLAKLDARVKGDATAKAKG
jgi:hypothetical protein